MGYFNFLIQGVNSSHDPYKRDKYPKNPKICYSGNVDHFQGTVKTINQNENTKTIQIDKIFETTTISDKIIQNSRKTWSELQKSTKMTFIVTLIGGLAGMVAAVAMGLLNPGLLIPAIAVGVVALSIFSFSFFARKRSQEAGNELNKWTDPLRDLIERCKKLNCRLKAEEKMKAEIASIITEKYQKIVELTSKGAIYKPLVKSELQTLALKINTIWTKHSLKSLEECKTEIPKENVYKILDPYIEQFPLLKAVKDILVVSPKSC